MLCCTCRPRWGPCLPVHLIRRDRFLPSLSGTALPKPIADLRPGIGPASPDRKQLLSTHIASGQSHDRDAGTRVDRESVTDPKRQQTFSISVGPNRKNKAPPFFFLLLPLSLSL